MEAFEASAGSKHGIVHHEQWRASAGPVWLPAVARSSAEDWGPLPVDVGAGLAKCALATAPFSADTRRGALDQRSATPRTSVAEAFGDLVASAKNRCSRVTINRSLSTHALDDLDGVAG